MVERGNSAGLLFLAIGQESRYEAMVERNDEEWLAKGVVVKKRLVFSGGISHSGARPPPGATQAKGAGLQSPSRRRRQSPGQSPETAQPRAAAEDKAGLRAGDLAEPELVRRGGMEAREWVDGVKHPEARSR